MPLKTLFLNPPSFENFDGGASSRWPATREIESYWYPVWLAYPAGMLQGSRLLDAPPHHVSAEETIKILKDYEFLVLFTSTPGFKGDCALAARLKELYPALKICFVGPHVTTLTEQSLPGAVHLLLVAAAIERASLAQALQRSRCRRNGEGERVLARSRRSFLRRRYLQHPEGAHH